MAVTTEWCLLLQVHTRIVSHVCYMDMDTRVDTHAHTFDIRCALPFQHRYGLTLHFVAYTGSEHTMDIHTRGHIHTHGISCVNKSSIAGMTWLLRVSRRHPLQTQSR